MNTLCAYFNEIIEDWEGHIAGRTNDNSFEPSALDNNGNNYQTSNAQPSMPSLILTAIDSVRLPATLPMITGPSRFISSATTNTAQDTSMSSIGPNLAQLSAPTSSAPSDPTISLLARGEPSQNSASNVSGINLDPRLSSIYSGPSETNRGVSTLLSTQSDRTSSSLLGTDEPVPPFEDPSQMEEGYMNNYEPDFGMGHGDYLGSMFNYQQREYE